MGEADFHIVDTPKAVTTQVDKVGHDKATGKLVPLSQLFTFADRTDAYLLFLGTLGAIATGVAQPLSIIAFGDVVNSFNPSGNIDPDVFQDDINKVCLFFLWIALGSFVSGFFYVACFTLSASRQIKRMREAYVRTLLCQEIGWFDVNEPMQLATKVADTTTKIQDGMGRKAGDGINFMAMGVSGVIIGLIKGWELALVLMAFTPVIAFSAFMMMKTLGDAVEGGVKAYGEAGGVAEEALGNIRTVQSFNGMAIATEKYDRALEKCVKAGIKKGLAMGIGTGAMFFTIYCTYSFGLYYGAVMVSEDILVEPRCIGTSCYDGGRVLIVFFSVIMGAMALGQAGPSLQAIFTARAAAYDMFQLLNRTSKIDPTSTSGQTLEKVEGHLELKKVHFRYPSRPEVVVCHDYSLDIKAGETMALVGASGSGKSTIVALLERFYSAEEGCITLDGHDISTLNTAWLRSQIGLVSQEPTLFAASISENIRYGQEDVTQKEIELAAKKSNAFDFIQSFPEGFETLVGEKGVQMSGGQKQRIAIARAIIKNPSILLLDEATSALDTESEKIVQESLDNLVKERKRTTIIIAHRLSTIRNSDRIAVHDKGAVVELGPHDELMQIEDGRYRKYVTTLSSGKKDVNVPVVSPVHKQKSTETSTSLSKNASFTYKQEDVDQPTDVAQIKSAEEGDEEKEELYEVSMSRVWGLSKADWPYYLFGGIGAAINGATFPVWGVLLVKMTVLFFRYDFTPDKMKDEARWWSIAFFLLGLAFLIACAMQNYGFAVASERLTKKLRVEGFKAMLRQDIAWFDLDENSTGALTTRLATDSALVQAMTSEMLNRNLVNFFTLTIAFGIAFWYSWEMTLVLMAVFPLLGFSSYIQMQMMGGTATGKIANDSDTKAGSLLSESIAAIRTVASFSMEERIIHTYYEYLAESDKQDSKSGVNAGVGFGLSNLINFGVQGLLFYVGGIFIKNGTIDFEEMFMVLLAVMLSSFGLGMAMQNMTEAGKTQRAASNLFKIIDRTPAIDASSTVGEILDPVKGDIEFRACDFVYPTRPHARVYDRLSLTIPAGQTVALVGSSGSGKSTAIGLVERFYDPQGGSVTLDGKALETLNLPWLRHTISLVGQEPKLFAGTIRENIAYGQREASLSEIHEAAKLANAYDFIQQLPQGFDTDVGDQGVQVSGGQKQRIAIARAIIRDPQVLLLDEATSALDSESERIVQESLDALLAKRRRTTLVIAHRLSTVRNADSICVIHEGRVAEKGTHDELMQIENGLYLALVHKQMAIAN